MCACLCVVCTRECSPHRSQKGVLDPWSSRYRQTLVIQCQNPRPLCVFKLRAISPAAPEHSYFRYFNPTSDQVDFNSPTFHTNNYIWNTFEREFYGLAFESIWQRVAQSCEPSAVTGHIWKILSEGAILGNKLFSNIMKFLWISNLTINDVYVTFHYVDI